MNFQNVKKLTIPEGEVAYIYLGNNLLWRRHSTPTAVLYNDGSMVFYADSAKIDTSKTIVGRYTGWDTDVYATTDAAVANTPWMGVATQIKSVSFVGTVSPISTAYWFFGCTNLTSVDLTNLYTNKLVYMAAMFYNCSSLVTLDLSMLNTSNLLNCNSMFAYCRNLTTIYVSDLWYTGKIADSGYMFYECTSLKGDISFNSNYIDKTYATYTSGYLTYKYVEPASGITFKVPTAVLYDDGSFIFYGAGSASNYTSNILASYTGWDVTDYRYANEIPWYTLRDSIVKVRFVGTVSPISMSCWFHSCTNLTEVDFTNIDTSKVSSLKYLFNKCASLVAIDLSGLNTSNVIEMSSICKDCNNLASINLDNFDTTKVTTMDTMFSGCDALTTLDLSSFNTLNVSTMRGMFSYSKSLTTIYVSDLWSTASLGSISYDSAQMFYQCESLVGDIPYNSSYTDATYATTTGGYLTLKQ